MDKEAFPPYVMIFFTTSVQIIRRRRDGTERRSTSPARVEGNTIRLPIGTEVQIGDHIQHHSLHDESRILTVIDVIHPHMSGASTIDDHIEITCVPTERLAAPVTTGPAPLHPALSSALRLAEEGRWSGAMFEAAQLVEKRIRSLPEGGDAVWPIDWVIGMWSSMLDIKMAATDPSAAETFEYLALASMLLRRLDRAGTGST